jgi:hypothetical protein
MSDSKYLNIYNDWKNRSIAEGFTFNQFWEHYNLYIDPMNSQPEECAIAAKLAYRSLVETRNAETQLNRQLETAQWI